MVCKAYDTLPTTPLLIVCKDIRALAFPADLCHIDCSYLPVSSVQYDLCPCVKFQPFA